MPRATAVLKSPKMRTATKSGAEKGPFGGFGSINGYFWQQQLRGKAPNRAGLAEKKGPPPAAADPKIRRELSGNSGSYLGDFLINLVN